MNKLLIRYNICFVLLHAATTAECVEEQKILSKIVWFKITLMYPDFLHNFYCYLISVMQLLKLTTVGETPLVNKKEIGNYLRKYFSTFIKTICIENIIDTVRRYHTLFAGETFEKFFLFSGTKRI